MTFVIKRGDLLPPFVVTLTDDGVPVNLSSATTIKANGYRHGVKVVDISIGGPFSTVGLVTVNWAAPMTDLLGLILFEFPVTWPGGKVQTFPQDGFERVRVSVDGA